MHSTFEIDNVADQYKYTIWRKWQNMTRAEQMIAKNILPNLLGVSPRTLLGRWMYYQHGDNKTIPADSLYKLSTFFNCDITEMWTNPPESLYKEAVKIKNQANQSAFGHQLAI